MSRRLSLPAEHGGYLTLVGATAAAMLLAAQPLRALGVGLAMAAGFFARGPLERWAEGKALARFDPLALVVYAAVAVAGVVATLPAGPALAAVAAAAGAAIPLLAVAAHRLGLASAPAFEYLGLGVMGASAGLAALVGAAPWETAAALTLVIGGNALTSVPVVRTEIRRKQGPASRAELLAALVVIAAAAALLHLLGYLGAALGLAPRVASILWRSVRRPTKVRVAPIAIREVVLLVAAIAACAAFVR